MESRWPLRLGTLAMLAWPMAGTLGAQSFSRVSVGPGGIQANGPSYSPALSRDGRVVVFRSAATNLDSRCANGLFQAFVHDRDTGATRCVSLNAAGQPADLGIADVAVSGNADVVAFVTQAANLDPTDTNGFRDVYVHRRSSGTTQRISDSQAPPTPTPTEGISTHPALSDDGRFVAYLSVASDQPTYAWDVRLYDAQTQTSSRVNRALDGSRGDGDSGAIAFDVAAGPSVFRPGVSADGRVISFVSGSTNLVVGDTNAAADVFAFDRIASTTERISVDHQGVQGAGASVGSLVSADGRAVAFVSRSALVGADQGGFADVYVRDRFGVTALISRALSGVSGNASSGGVGVSSLFSYAAPSVNRDGRYVGFVSVASDLAPGCGGTGPNGDLFVHDRAIGSTMCVTRGGNGASSREISMAPSGTVVAFASDATNLVSSVSDTNQVSDIIVVSLAVPFGAESETPVPADYDGDGQVDRAVFLRGRGVWAMSPSASPFAAIGWGAAVAGLGDMPVRGDFDGDGRADVAVYRTSTGEWFIRASSAGFIRHVWGSAFDGDIPVAADYDGDARTDISVYRRRTGQWFIARSSGGVMTVSWGAPFFFDAPTPADYDGDGRADVAVYRTTTGEWFVWRSGSNTSVVVQLGPRGRDDRPVPADYDGDHRADIAIYRAGTGEWFIRRSLTEAMVRVDWGAVLLDVPVPADYDGDGRADLAVFRPTTGEWWLAYAPNVFNIERFLL